MSISNPSEGCVKPLVVRPRVARQMYGDCSNDTIYDKIKSGAVKSYLDGARRLIVVASIEADIARNAAAAAASGFHALRKPKQAPHQRRRPRIAGTTSGSAA